jgi:hypothetical protein
MPIVVNPVSFRPTVRPLWTALLACESVRLASAIAHLCWVAGKSVQGQLPRESPTGPPFHPAGAGVRVPAATSCLFGRTWAGPERTPGLRNDPMHAPKHMHVGRMQAYKPCSEARYT